MYVVTTEVAPHVRVSRTLDKVAHFSREPRERRAERRQLNKLAAVNARRFNPRPRLVKAAQPELTVISLDAFKTSRPVDEVVETTLIPVTVATFDKREVVAQQAGL